MNFDGTVVRTAALGAALALIIPGHAQAQDGGGDVRVTPDGRGGYIAEIRPDGPRDPGGNGSGNSSGGQGNGGGGSGSGGAGGGAGGNGRDFSGFGNFDRPLEGGRGGNGSGGDSGRGSAGPAFRGPPVSITLGGSTFSVQPQTAIRFSDLLGEYESTTAWGNFTAIAASVFTLFGLLEPPTGPVGATRSLIAQTVERVRDGSTSAQDLADKLRAPSIMNNALRVKMIDALMYEELDARKRGDRDGARMFSRLRDMLQNSSRYRDGGIEYRNSRLILRNPAAESWREVTAYSITPGDWAATQAFLRDLSQHAGLRGILADGDMYWDAVMGVSRDKVTMRDMILIATALDSIKGPYRAALENRLAETAAVPNASSGYWNALTRLAKDPGSWRQQDAAMLLPDPVSESLEVTEDMPQIAEMYRW